MLGGIARWFGIALAGLGVLCALGGLTGDTPMLVSGILFMVVGGALYLFGRVGRGFRGGGGGGGDPLYAATRERDDAIYAVQRSGQQVIAQLTQQEKHKARTAIARAQRRTRELEGAWL